MNTFSSIKSAAEAGWTEKVIGHGYVYAIFFFDGVLKVGTTENPLERFSSYLKQSTQTGDGLVFVGGRTFAHLGFERDLVKALRPICRSPKNPVCEWFFADLSILQPVVKFLEHGYGGQYLAPIHFAALMSPRCAPEKVKWGINEFPAQSYQKPLLNKSRLAAQ